MELVSAIAGYVKDSAPTAFCTLLVASAILLFGPVGWTDSMGLTTFVLAYRPYVGGAFVLSSAGLLTAVAVLLGRAVVALYRRVQLRREAKERRLKGERRLHKLTAAEQGYVKLFLETAECIRFDVQDALAAKLVRLRILSCPSGAGHLLYGIEHVLADWAREYLECHPECIANAVDVSERVSPQDFR